jgi:ABC-2 type transport system ATP-binding protein
MTLPVPDSATSPAHANLPPVVVASGLTKVFKDFWGRDKARAVDGVDFTIRSGEVFGLLGPNGSGKSTTLKLLLGLLRPTRGRIEVFGQGPEDVRTKERIGYLPEESHLYRYFNPVEALDFFGKLFDLPAEERRRRTEQLLEMVGLAGARRRALGEFSKGMQRRIGLAQALINDPDLVILDEPTAGLDPLGCREVKDLILALARRGKTVILSSHLLGDVEDVCDRVVIYYGGRIQAQGAMKDLLATPEEVQLTLPAKPREDMARLLRFLREDLQEERVRVAVPTQNLEGYFLSVVRRARAASVPTSGAATSGAVAPYLKAGLATTGGGMGEARVLERLQGGEERKETSPAGNPVAAVPASETGRSERDAEANDRLSRFMGDSGTPG